MAWTFAARAADVGESGLLGVVCDGTPLALCRTGRGYVALLDRCPHQGARLSEGCVVEGYVECQLHFGLFDLQTGASDGSMTPNAVQTFPARLVGDTIEVDLERHP